MLLRAGLANARRRPTENPQKKAVSFENGYQTWGGGMKNLFGFPYSLYRQSEKKL